MKFGRELAAQTRENGQIDNPTIATMPRYARALGRKVLVSLVEEVDHIPLGGATDKPPRWWPSDQIANFNVRQWLAGPDTKSPPPQIRIRFGVPVTGYLNSAQNKEVSFQGSGEDPFVLALDVAELPGAFSIFRRELPGWFQTWTRFSGVLIFRPTMWVDKIGWEWELCPNPDAIHKLPEAMLKHIPKENPPYPTWAPLFSVEEGG